MALTQAEYRLHFAKRHGVVLFGSMGEVASKVSNFELNQSHYGGGIGYRFMLNTKDRINIRVDYALGTGGTSGLYFAIGEAF